MKLDPISRIWSDVTGLLVPLLAIVSYVFVWPSAVRTVLTLLAFAGIYGPWFTDGGWRRSRFTRIAHVRTRARRRRTRRARA